MYCQNHVGKQTYWDFAWPNDFNNVYVQNQNLIMSIQSAFTRSASFLWPDNGTQFESFFLFTNAITEQSLLSNMWMYIIVEMLIMIVHNALCQKLSSNFMLYAGHNLIVIIMSHNMNCFKNIKPWSLKKISTMLTKKMHTTACGAIQQIHICN